MTPTWERLQPRSPAQRRRQRPTLAPHQAATSAKAAFDFRAFLNLAMLVAESERARLLRQAILDIVIDTINQRTGGGTNYINQRDEEFLHAAFVKEDYRKQLTDALRDCVAMGNFKYAVYTDKIYVSIFREKAHEYRKILKLERKDLLIP